MARKGGGRATRTTAATDAFEDQHAKLIADWAHRDHERQRDATRWEDGVLPARGFQGENAQGIGHAR